MEKQDWCPFGLSVVVKDGIVHLSGVITEERSRQAAVVAAENVTGVKKGPRSSVLGRYHVRDVSELSGRRGLRQGQLIKRRTDWELVGAPLVRAQLQRGTTAVASISTRAAFSTRRTTWTSAIAG